MSADGSVILAAASYDGCYVSTNAGATWTNTLHTLYVSSPTCSADGKKDFIIVKDFNSRLSCSTNFGFSWFTVTTNFPPMSFMTSSADGNTLVGGGSSGLFTSTNAGVDWITNFSGNWTCAAASANGRRWVAGSGNLYGIVTSTNFGINWTSNSVPPNQSWASVATSVDGSILMATAPSSPHPGLLISTNSGGNWISNSLPEPYNTPHFTASTDLRKLAVWLSPSIGHIYTSEDFGNTWVSNSVPRDSWLQVTSTADGNKLVAIQNDSIWVKTEANAPHLSLKGLNDTLNLSWLIPSTGFVLEENLDLSSTNWTAVTNLPSLNFSNLDYELSVTTSQSNGYFRLAPK